MMATWRYNLEERAAGICCVSGWKGGAIYSISGGKDSAVLENRRDVAILLTYESKFVQVMQVFPHSGLYSQV